MRSDPRRSREWQDRVNRIRIEFIKRNPEKSRFYNARYKENRKKRDPFFLPLQRVRSAIWRRKVRGVVSGVDPYDGISEEIGFFVDMAGDFL